jgi:hypothetical protein
MFTTMNFRRQLAGLALLLVATLGAAAPAPVSAAGRSARSCHGMCPKGIAGYATRPAAPLARRAGGAYLAARTAALAEADEAGTAVAATASWDKVATA